MYHVCVCVYHDIEVSTLRSSVRGKQRCVVQQLFQQLCGLVEMLLPSAELALSVHTQQGVYLTLITCREVKGRSHKTTRECSIALCREWLFGETKSPHPAAAGSSSIEILLLAERSVKYICHSSASPIPVSQRAICHITQDKESQKLLYLLYLTVEKALISGLFKSSWAQDLLTFKCLKRQDQPADF